MDYKKKSRDSFNKQAWTYDEDFNSEHARKIYNHIIKATGNLDGKKILDVGCGTGNVLKMLHDKYREAQLYGIDISEKMLEKAKVKLQDNADLILGDSENLPYSNSSFDVIICNDSFHHYPNPEGVLREFNRVLKDGGIFILGDCWQPLITRNIMNFLLKLNLMNCGDVKMYSEKEICSMLSSNKFRHIDFKLVNDRTYLVKSVK